MSPLTDVHDRYQAALAEAQRFFRGGPRGEGGRALERRFPGDGKPKPVAFPDPALVAEVRGETAILKLEVLVELKLASGQSAAHRLQDLADVIALIRANSLPRDWSSRLDASVRAKYVELWEAAQQGSGEED